MRTADDFKLHCGSGGWQRAWLGLRWDVGIGGREQADLVCPKGTALTGVQVMRGRSKGKDSRDCARGRAIDAAR